MSSYPLPASFIALMHLAANTPPTCDRYPHTVGAIALLLSAIANQEDADLFRGLLREIALAVSNSTAKRILKLAQQGLAEEQQQWLQAQIEAVLAGE